MYLYLSLCRHFLFSGSASKFYLFHKTREKDCVTYWPVLGSIRKSVFPPRPALPCSGLSPSRWSWQLRLLCGTSSKGQGEAGWGGRGLGWRWGGGGRICPASNPGSAHSLVLSSGGCSGGVGVPHPGGISGLFLGMLISAGLGLSSSHFSPPSC